MAATTETPTVPQQTNSSSKIPTQPTLAEQLNQEEAKNRTMMPAEAVAGIDATNKTLAARYTPSPLPIGSKAPDFTLANATGNKVTLSSLLQENNSVIITWYRGGWCPYCNLTLRAMTQSNDQFIKYGAKLIALSPETPDESMSMVEKHQLAFEVLSDDGLSVAEKYGVVFQVGDDMKSLYSSFNINLDKMNGNEQAGRKARLPLPATFVVGKDGKIVYQFAHVDYTKRAEPAQIIDVVKKLAQDA